MAIKKNELYSSLWAACDKLRDGMDASLYKDYILVLLFVKYVSDKYANDPYPSITVPKGTSFADLVKLKGKTTIGDDINKKIIGKIAEANGLTGTIDVANFNDPAKFGEGKTMVDRLSGLIAIFEDKRLDFSKNKAEGDDILGDAYEYLMRHFAAESGKSKGQFYTPAEVSRILAKILGVNSKNAKSDTTVYDPTCGSGSLLLKVGDEAQKEISLYGQEQNPSTAALARMNMVLHNHPTAVQRIWQGNTLSTPKWADGNELKQFDYAVANPPFSSKSWMDGVKPETDNFKRFQDFGIPPKKNGDYAFLLHILRSLKPRKGKAAIILPHGVLFRGNAEATIRTSLINKGFIKGIIGLPANLFYGTGIPACIIVIDKEGAETRNSIFMIDASKGFMKDGNKNRLREQDIHKIVDVFNKRLEVEKFSREVPMDEIKKNEFNLNLPRYIDSQEAEDLQDIEAHLLGDIPNADVEALQSYWDVCPKLKNEIFGKSDRKSYSTIKVAKDQIKTKIFTHPEFTAFIQDLDTVFYAWKTKNVKKLKSLKEEIKPRDVIFDLSEDILETYSDKKLIDKYDVYQHLMNYWQEAMQDDVYVISSDGWKSGNTVTRLQKTTKRGEKETVKDIEGIDGLEGLLIPPHLIISKFFSKEQKAIDDLNTKKEAAAAKIEELKEEHTGEDGLLNEAVDDKDKITKKSVQQRIKALGKENEENKEELAVLKEFMKCSDDEGDASSAIKTALKELEAKVQKKYPELTENEIKEIVVQDKWLSSIEKSIKTENDRISQRLTQRIKELAERYETPMPSIANDVKDLEQKVTEHLNKMGFSWS